MFNRIFAPALITLTSVFLVTSVWVSAQSVTVTDQTERSVDPGTKKELKDQRRMDKKSRMKKRQLIVAVADSSIKTEEIATVHGI